LHEEVVSTVVVITMTYTGTQQREEWTNSGRYGENGEVQDERDEPTPTSKEPPSRNQNENVQQYYDRLNAWADEQLQKNAPKYRPGEDDINDFLKRIAAITKRINGKVTDAKLNDRDAKHKEAIREKDAKIREKDAKIREKDAKINYHDTDASVEQLLNVHQGLPKLRRNTKAESSIKNRNGKRENDDNDEVGDEVGPKKTKGLLHKPATILNLDPFDICLEDLKVNFKEKGKDGVVKQVKSVLGACLGKLRDDKNAKLSNFNESSPSLHIVNALKDVRSCLGLGGEVEVAQEMSFFSMRPDIVVLKYMDAIVLIIEIKNEGRDAKTVMKSEVAAGQCLDYTYALKRTNIDIPIVCLSTYSMMRIGSSEENIENIVSEAFKRLGEVNEHNPFRHIPVEIEKPISSPEKKGNATKVPYDQIETPDLCACPVDSYSLDRKIYFSSTFGYHNMFKALYLAVACGCISAEASQAANGDVSNLNHNRIPMEGEVLKDRWYNVVQAESYTWTKVREIKVTYELKKSWQPNTRVFMGDVLGMGQTGKVYLCMDYAGRHFALKMLFYDSKVMESFDPDRRMSSRIEHMKKIRKILQTEAERWKKIYPQYKDSIWEGILNELPCLAMPYIASIPKERREDLRDEIKKEMERLAKLGFVYNKTDTRWRHIGLRMNNKRKETIIFVDMESLEEVDENLSDEKRNKCVKNCMDSLYDRI